MLLNKIVLSKTPPTSPNTVWAKPLNGGVSLYTYSNNKWGPILLMDDMGTDNPDDDLPGKVITLKLFDETILDLKDYVSENYASNTKVSQIISRLNTLVGADEEGHEIDVTSVIDTFNEIKDFLANIEDTTLIELFDLVNTRINTLTQQVSNTLLLVGIDDIPEFDSTKNYSANDLVIYSDKLYKFIETHSAGAWIGTDTLETNLVKEIGQTYNIVESINNALAELSPDQQEALAVVAKANANEAKLGYYVCDTDANTAAKTIAATGYVLGTGGNIRIKMTNANTADAVTLNINNTGAKALFYNGTQASSTNSWEAGEVIEVYYDGTNYQASNTQGGGGKAEKIKYDNSQSGLAADNVQEALDEMDNEVTKLTGEVIDDEKVIAQVLLSHKGKIDKAEENANQVPGIKERLSAVEEATNQIPSIKERLSNAEKDLESTDLVVAHALTRLNSVAKNIGNGYKADYSEELEVIEIPKPTALTKMNIISSTLPTSKATVLDATIEFWDKNGNYFKKPITEFTIQGNSSARYGFQKLNFGFDIADGSKIKFGDWVPQDSFHLKANFIDSFRGARNIIAYHVWEKQLNDRGWIAGRPWRKLADADITTSHGTGSLNEDFNSDAKGVPDGFAVKVYWNNEFYGLFTLQLKKHRDNYAMGKSKAKHIFIDGYLDKLFTGEANINWTRFELRNPKGLKDIDGNKYDGDSPKELSDTDEFSATVKGYVKDLSNRCNAIASAEDLVAIIDKDYAIDYLLNVNYMGNDDVLTNNTMYCTWDGNLWFTLLYDSDQSFGLEWEGITHSVNISREVFGVNKATGTPMDKFFTWFKSDMDARYKELRDNGIFNVKNIIKELSDWVAMIGTDNFDAEFAKWDETPSYRDGSLTYTHNPRTGGFYDSIGTVEKWLKERTAFLDSYFNYNN